MNKTLIIDVDKIKELEQSRRNINKEYDNLRRKLHGIIYNDIMSCRESITAHELSDLIGLSVPACANLLWSMYTRSTAHYRVHRKEVFITRTFYEFKNGTIDFESEMTTSYQVWAYYRD